MTILFILAILAIALYCFSLYNNDPYERMIQDELAWDSKLERFYNADPPLDMNEEVL
jgi:hypothetical protein